MNTAATVDLHPGARYPFRPSCTACGWDNFGRGYLTAQAAQIVADDHKCQGA